MSSMAVRVALSNHAMTRRLQFALASSKTMVYRRFRVPLIWQGLCMHTQPVPSAEPQNNAAPSALQIELKR